MIISGLDNFGAPRTMRCQQMLANCVRMKRRRRIPLARAQRLCALQIRCPRARHLFGVDLDGIEPSMIMAVGVIPAWQRKNPRYPLTEVTNMTQQQTHPLAGLIGHWF